MDGGFGGRFQQQKHLQPRAMETQYNAFVLCISIFEAVKPRLPTSNHDRLSRNELREPFALGFVRSSAPPSNKAPLSTFLLLRIDIYSIGKGIAITCINGWYMILVSVHNRDDLHDCLLQRGLHGATDFDSVCQIDKHGCNTNGGCTASNENRERY